MVAYGQIEFMTFNFSSWRRSNHHSAARCFLCRVGFQHPDSFRGPGVGYQVSSNLLRRSSPGLPTFGLQVVMPSTSRCDGLLKSAILDDDPVISSNRSE